MRERWKWDSASANHRAGLSDQKGGSFDNPKMEPNSSRGTAVLLDGAGALAGAEVILALFFEASAA